MPSYRDELRDYLFDSAGIEEISPTELRDYGITESYLRDLFEEGVLTRRDEMSPEQASEARESWREFWEWMEELGYDDTYFDWDAWREYMGYNAA